MHPKLILKLTEYSLYLDALTYMGKTDIVLQEKIARVHNIISRLLEREDNVSYKF